MKITDKIKQEIINIISEYINLDNCTIFLFGSYAQGKAKQSSDIDIGIVCTYPLNLDKILKVKAELNEKVNILRDIDLIDFNTDLDPEFKEIALKDIEIWHKTKESEEILSSMNKL